MPDIKVTTGADLSGFRAMQAEMQKLISQAERYSAIMRSADQVQSGRSQVAAGAAPSYGGAPGVSRGRTIGSGSGRYNLTNSSGVAQYYENVLMPAMGSLGIRGGHGGMTHVGGVKYQPYGVQASTTPVTAAQMKTWFQGLGAQFQKMDRDIQQAYLSALDSSSRSTSLLPGAIKQFAKEYGGQLGAPTPSTTQTVLSQSRGSRFLQHFVNNAKGGSGFGGMLMGGLKGGLAGSAIDMLAGGGEAGAAAGGLGAAGIGGMLGGLPGAAIATAVSSVIGWVGGQLKQGMQTYSDTAQAFSQFSHALDGATNSAEGFRQATLRAGAVTGMNAQDTAATAATLMGAYGNSLGTRGLTNLTRYAGAFALQNGLQPGQAAAIDALGAQLGITNGRGSSINPLAFNKMLANVATQGGMQGRQGAAFTGLMSVYSQLGSMSPVINSANSTAAIYTAMSASGVQGLQGQAGANILSTMNSNVGSGQGLGGVMGMAAIYQASGGKITNPWQMRSIQEQGLGAKIDNTTLGASLLGIVKRAAPGDIYTQAGLLSSMTGITENQAIQMLKSGALGAQSISTRNNQHQKNTVYDVNNIAKNVLNAQFSKLGYANALLKSLAAKGLAVPTDSTLNGTYGNAYAGGTGGSVDSSGNPVVNARIGNPLSALQDKYTPSAPQVGPISSNVLRWSAQVKAASRKTGVPASVIDAIMQGESGGGQWAGTLNGAFGLMQLEPGTAGATNAQRANPSTNILYGAKYLKSLYNRFHHNWSLATAAYYAGPGSVESHVPKSAYGDNLNQLSKYLDYTPPGNSMTVEQYALDALSRATGTASGNVVSLSPDTIQQIVDGFSRTVAHLLAATPSH